MDLETFYVQRMEERTPVTVHQNQQPILRDGKIDQTLLFSVLQENNEAYFADEDRNYMHTPMKSEQEIQSVIQLISESIEYDLPKLSQAEQARLNCLLGDLKIVQASGLSLAAVVMETNVLYVNPPMMDVGELSSGNENTYRNTLYHEAKHLLQSDCPCYYGEAAYRQTGTMRLPVQADPLDPFRNFWFIEGCAEKAACNQTGDAPVSYQNQVGYVESLDLAALLSSQAKDEYAVEDHTLRRDTLGLLSILSAEKRDRRLQVQRMLWGMEIVQGYADQLQEELKLSDDAFLALRLQIKASCCAEIARCYYRNLALALKEAQNVTMEDPCCLMTVFKGDFYYYFETTPEDLGQVPLELLWQMEEQFLAAVGAGQEKSLEQLKQEWRSYPLWQETPGKSLNATLSWIPSAKKEYLIQRAGGDHVLYLPTACELLKTLYQEG